MRLSASDFYPPYRPSKCDLRVYLRSKGEREAEPGPYHEVLVSLGLRHERAHLATLPEHLDLSDGSEDDRLKRTREAVDEGAPVLCQAVLRAGTTLNGTACEIIGEPDFLVKTNGGYAIRDSKMSRRITDKDHPEIIKQLEVYGWLYEQTFGEAPVRLEVHSGSGDIVQIPYDSAAGLAALQELERILLLKQLNAEPYAPVGWSKCGGCGFHQRCWSRAEQVRDVALVTGVDQGLAQGLLDLGVKTMDQLLESFDAVELAEFQRPWGTRTQRVGKNAEAILRSARALASGEQIVIETPALPESDNYVMFDLEGLPPQLDELDKVFLWGLQVFGKTPGPFIAAEAGFGEGGDEAGWVAFLNAADEIFSEHGDIPFVHWHHYERVKVSTYIDRFGDRGATAARVKENLLDLLPVTQKSVALPLPSYSLKVVEKYVGFKRTLEDVAGDWAMAQYIEATETEDEEKRAEITSAILEYNREDLEATWAVFNWLAGVRE